MKELVFYRSYWKSFLLLLINGLFVVLGIYLVASGDSEEALIGWLCVGVFSFGTVVGGYLLFNKTPQLTISTKGIKNKALQKATKQEWLEWEMIQEVSLFTMNNNKFLGLKVAPAALAKKKKSRLAKGLGKINKKLGMPDLSIPLAIIDVKAKGLVPFINEMIRTPPQQRATKLRSLEQQYLS